MKSPKTDEAITAGGNPIKQNQRFSKWQFLKNNSDSFPRNFVYFLIFLSFLTQFVFFYYFHIQYHDFKMKYDIKLEELNGKIKSYELSLRRVKRDLEVKDNSLMKPAINEIKADITEAELSKNDSTLTIEEVIHFKQNLSTEDWVWLNKYSRVPLKIMEEFCKTTHEKCPLQKGDPGEKGDQGDKGEKGDQGQNGSPGQKGSIGVRGPIGPVGAKGEKGEKGNQGLDGRPSVPGEPGLDGVPGRSGKDGTPGQKGEPGRNGIPGINGINGSNGEKGSKGEQGEKGEQGTPGLPGPKGRPGKAGMDGIPGQPGISAKNCSINGTNQILIPPTIVGSEPAFYVKNITVDENEHLKVTCTSTGFPTPVHVWRRIEDGNQIPILQGPWSEINSAAGVLTFKNISRKFMGEYICLADNGIPPPANQSFFLNVHFPPYIAIHSVILNVTLDSIALLSCKIEAFPRGVYYWETAQGKLLEQSTDRFQVDYKHNGLYETELILNITNIRKEDLGIYYCVGKNIKGITQGYINVTDNPRKIISPATEVCNNQRITFFGDPPPPLDGNVCPECLQCKICGFGYRDLQLNILSNNSNSALVRTRNCEMETIGKPVYHNSMPDKYGSWMKDSYADSGDYYWVTKEQNNTHLYEYANKSVFITKEASKIYKLSEPIAGNDHIIYNRSFYYFTKKSNATLIKYDLREEQSKKSLALNNCDTSQENHLYKTEYNNVDIMADNNGIWVVCAVINSNNTAVIKVNVSSFEEECSWNISVKHQDIGDMFIICGVLYAVDSVTEFQTKISLALDLYKRKLLNEVEIPFTNPFKNTTMISYNNRLNELYTWDSGNMLTYPIKCNELSSDTTSSNETQSVIPNEINERAKKNL